MEEYSFKPDKLDITDYVFQFGLIIEGKDPERSDRGIEGAISFFKTQKEKGWQCEAFIKIEENIVGIRSYPNPINN